MSEIIDTVEIERDLLVASETVAVEVLTDAGELSPVIALESETLVTDEYSDVHVIEGQSELVVVSVGEQGPPGPGGAASGPKLVLVDATSATVIYRGEAALGTATSAPGWRIQKITTDAAGNVLSVLYAAGGAATAVWDNRAALSYA